MMSIGQRLCAKTAVLVGFIVGLCGPSFAFDTCKDFSFTFNIHKVDREDRGAEGESSFDTQVGIGNILDEDGNLIGQAYFRTEMAPQGPRSVEGERVLLFDSHYVFPAGTLTVTGVTPRNTQRTVDLPDVELSYPVIGGTGAFAGASGQLHAKTQSNGERTHTFEISC